MLGILANGLDCDMGEYFKDSTCMKSFADDLVVTCDEILDTPDTTSINPNDKTNYWLITTVLLAVTWLLLLAVIVVKYHVKDELTILCLLSY